MWIYKEIKYIAIIIILIIMYSASCLPDEKKGRKDEKLNSNTELKNNTLSLNSSKLKSHKLIINTIDTLAMKKMSIDFKEIQNKKRKKWLFIYRDSTPKTQEIKGVNIYFSQPKREQSNELFAYLDSIALRLNNGSHTINSERFELFANKIELLKSTSFIEYGDFNFDKYTDFRIKDHAAGGNRHDIRRYYLYDYKSNRFKYSKTLSGFSNLQYDRGQKTISTFWNGGHAGRIHGKAKYKISGVDKLIPIEIKSQEYIKSLKMYSREDKYYRDDGTVKIYRDTVGYPDK